MLKNLIIRDLSIAGNVFILPVYNASNSVIWYQVLDPRTLRIVANKYWEVVRYLQVRWGNVIYFNPDELFHFKDMVDHDNEVLWISKIETLVFDILSDKESGRSNYAFFKNNAIPSTIITLDNELSPEEINIALAQLKKQFSGWENKHRISASSGIKDVKVLGNSIKDMEFVALRWFTTERICASMWVPKTILWYSDNVNYSTSDNHYRKYIKNTIYPLSYSVEYIFNKLISIIDPNIKFEFIPDEDYDFLGKISTYEKLISIWLMTVNEARIELWRDPYIDDIANQPIIKSWYTLIQDIWISNIQEVPPNQI
jgi:HK97 family phage portal protein